MLEHLLSLITDTIPISAWLRPIEFVGLNITFTYSVSISEASANGFTYTTIEANNNPTAYTIIHQTVDGAFGMFENGTLYVQSSNGLDYEALREHVITVTYVLFYSVILPVDIKIKHCMGLTMLYFVFVLHSYVNVCPVGSFFNDYIFHFILTTKTTWSGLTKRYTVIDPREIEA